MIDVNGWSFVKGNDHYYDQCARLLSEAFLRSVQRRPSTVLHEIPRELLTENAWRLKGFAAVFRHGDRTPKNKYKISLMTQPFIDLLEGSTQEVVFRQKHQLDLVKDAIIKSMDLGIDVDKLLAIKEILERKSELPGTKVQVKPVFDKDSNILRKLQVNVKWGGEVHIHTRNITLKYFVNHVVYSYFLVYTCRSTSIQGFGRESPKRYEHSK